MIFRLSNSRYVSRLRTGKLLQRFGGRTLAVRASTGPALATMNIELFICQKVRGTGGYRGAGASAPAAGLRPMNANGGWKPSRELSSTRAGWSLWLFYTDHWLEFFYKFLWRFRDVLCL